MRFFSNVNILFLLILLHENVNCILLVIPKSIIVKQINQLKQSKHLSFYRKDADSILTGNNNHLFDFLPNLGSRMNGRTNRRSFTIPRNNLEDFFGRKTNKGQKLIRNFKYMKTYYNN